MFDSDPFHLSVEARHAGLNVVVRWRPGDASAEVTLLISQRPHEHVGILPVLVAGGSPPIVTLEQFQRYLDAFDWQPWLTGLGFAPPPPEDDGGPYPA